MENSHICRREGVVLLKTFQTGFFLSYDCQGSNYSRSVQLSNILSSFSFPMSQTVSEKGIEFIMAFFFYLLFFLIHIYLYMKTKTM